MRLLSDGDDTEINVWRKASIQSHFVVASTLSRFNCAKVNKVEFHGLLELENQVARQEYPRDVRLNNLHASWRRRIGRRHAEPCDDLLVKVRRHLLAANCNFPRFFRRRAKRAAI